MSSSRELGLIMVPRSCLAGVQPAHGDQAEPEVADFGQQQGPGITRRWQASGILW